MFPDVQASLRDVILEVEVKKSHLHVIIAFFRERSFLMFFFQTSLYITVFLVYISFSFMDFQILTSSPALSTSYT